MAASTKSLSVHRDAYPTDNQGKMVSIKIPDMFSSFLSVPPRINPLYREVKMESETWISEYESLRYYYPSPDNS